MASASPHAHSIRNSLLALSCAALAAGCVVSRPQQRQASAGYINPDEAGEVSGAGVEGQDIRAMTDRMARDILSTPEIAALPKAPYVIIDDEFFFNESSSPINKRMITERLAIELTRAAKGRMRFVERQAEGMVAQERYRKREGEVGAGSLEPTAKIAGADFRLQGRIMDLTTVRARTGQQTRYNQITFKLIDLESGLTVWSNIYEFSKNAASDTLYY